MNNKIEWLKTRRTYIGGSDISAIVGVNKYVSPLELYLEKTSIEEPKLNNSEVAYWGTILEEIIAKEYRRRNPEAVEALTMHKELFPLKHPKYEYLGANIDRWIYPYFVDDPKSTKEGKYILECKTINKITAKKELGEEFTDQIPESWLCQVAWYSAICRVPKVDIAVLIGGQEFRIYTYKKDKELEAKLIDIAISFWNNHVLPKIPPQPVCYKDILYTYRKAQDKSIEATDDIYKSFEKLKDLKVKEKEINKQIKETVPLLQSFMKEHDSLTDPSGKTLITWKNGADRTKLDEKRLKAEHPKLYKKYLLNIEGSRIFRVNTK